MGLDGQNHPGVDAEGRARITIGGLMLLVAAVGGLAWAVRRSNGGGFLLKHWPLVVLIVLPLYGLVWSTLRVYRVGPDRQTPSIVVMVASMLSLLFGWLVYGWFIGGFES